MIYHLNGKELAVEVKGRIDTWPYNIQLECLHSTSEKFKAESVHMAQFCKRDMYFPCFDCTDTMNESFSLSDKHYCGGSLYSMTVNQRIDAPLTRSEPYYFSTGIGLQ